MNEKARETDPFAEIFAEARRQARYEQEHVSAYTQDMIDNRRKQIRKDQIEERKWRW